MDEHLLHSVTISLTVKVDMQDEMQNFVSPKSWPCLNVSLGDQTREHRFSQPAKLLFHIYILVGLVNGDWQCERLY